MSYRVVSRGAILIPILLLLFRLSEAYPSPAPAPLFGLLGDALGGGNATSLIAALALAHIEHTIDKLNALADVAGTLLSSG